MTKPSKKSKIFNQAQEQYLGELDAFFTNLPKIQTQKGVIKLGARPYLGYVYHPEEVPVDYMKPNGPKWKKWRVRIVTPGKYYKKAATIDRDNVPAGIRPAVYVRFELKDIGGKNKSLLIATNAVLDPKPSIS